MNLCRICYEPCCFTEKCLHNCCLEKWVRMSGNTHCRLCNTPFVGIQACDDLVKLRECANVYELRMSPISFTFAIITAVIIRGMYNGTYACT